jgi:hypothetical protein
VIRDGSTIGTRLWKADDADMLRRIEGRDQLAEPARRHHQRIAAGQDHLPDLATLANVGERSLELVRRQRLAARADLLAAKAEAAIDRADMAAAFRQHAVGIAVDDALHRRARLVADRIGLSSSGRDLCLLRARHELAARSDRGRRCAIDQQRHLRRERDRHRLRRLERAADRARPGLRAPAPRGTARVCIAAWNSRKRCFQPVRKTSIIRA